MYNSPLHVEKHATKDGRVLIGEVAYCADAANPREWDNLSTLLLHPNKSCWTVEKRYQSPYYEGDLIVDLDIDKGDAPYEHLENLIKHQLRMRPSDVVAYPITKYEHGCISLSLGYREGWDCGVVGFVFATKEKIRYAYGVKRVTKSVLEKVKNVMESELDDLSQWLNGEVYEYAIKEVTLDECGDVVDTVCLDSCAGFYGYDAAIEEMQTALQHHLKDEQANA